MDGKKILSEILDYYKYKVDNNLCTPAEIESASKLLQENMEMYGSISDIAKFYKVPESKVRNTINRRMIAKPVRRVFYPFHLFQKIVPEKWRVNLGKVDQNAQDG